MNKELLIAIIGLLIANMIVIIMQRIKIEDLIDEIIEKENIIKELEMKKDEK
ncbi:MAG: hypothetical protein J6T10_21545 [Methanobrevibacter sp.]|nr:hypothetical protein [Methanobrevibacter sp.]